MNVKRNTSTYDPVQIELQTKEEVRAVLRALDTYATVTDVPKYLEIATRLANEISKVAG